MGRFRVAAVALLLVAGSLAAPTAISAADPEADPEASPTLTAYLDGKPIPLADVSKYYCDDFSYPVIQCSRLALAVELRSTLVLLLTSVNYVTIWDYVNFGGPYMHVSQDYAVLATIGWNDRISSFKGRNSETGRFWTDWFNGGTSSSFCCNTTVSSLGSFDNAFSSIERT